MFSSSASLEEEIGRKLAEAAAAGQLEQGRGQPLQVDEAWLQTPPGLRMAFQVMKSAGVPPAEVELFQQRASLRASLAAAADEATRQRLQRQLAELEQNIAFRTTSAAHIEYWFGRPSIRIDFTDPDQEGDQVLNLCGPIVMGDSLSSES